MSAKITQLSGSQARLDNAIKSGAVRQGDRFLYTIDGTGKCYEATLLEISPESHVKLDTTGAWHWPPEVHIEEMLFHAEEADLPASRPAAPLPFAKPVTSTTKSKRYT